MLELGTQVPDGVLRMQKPGIVDRAERMIQIKAARECTLHLSVFVSGLTWLKHGGVVIVSGNFMA